MCSYVYVCYIPVYVYSVHMYSMFACHIVGRCIVLLVCLTVPSGPVTNLVPRNINATTVELSWDPVNERQQNGIIVSYNIYYQLNYSFDPYMMVLGVTERVSVTLYQ